jgi:hypothetical protein
VSRLDESSRETTLSDEEANNTGDIEDSARGDSPHPVSPVLSSQEVSHEE